MRLEHSIVPADMGSTTTGSRRHYRGEGSIWYQCKYCVWKDKMSPTAQGDQLQPLTQMGRLLPYNPGLKPGLRGVPFLRCPGGCSSPILAMPTHCRFEYTSSSDSLWSLGGMES